MCVCMCISVGDDRDLMKKKEKVVLGEVVFKGRTKPEGEGDIVAS